MADLLVFVASGNTFTGSTPAGTKHGKLPTNVLNDVRMGANRLRIAEIDRDTSGALLIGGQAESTSVSLGRTGQDVNTLGLMSMPSSAWDDSHMKFTVGADTWHFWVQETSGTLRFKKTPAPASDGDGAPVGGGGGSGVSSVFVYRPGGVAADNVFTNWDLLYTAVTAVEGPVIIAVDDSTVTPALLSGAVGSYDLSGVTFIGHDQSVTGPKSVLRVEELLSNLPDCVGDNCNLQANLAGDISQAPVGATARMEVCARGTLSSVNTGVLVNLPTGSIFTLDLEGTVDSVNPVIHIADTVGNATALAVLAGESAVMGSGAVSSVAGAGMTAFHTSTASAIDDPIPFGGYNGAFTRTLINDSLLEKYDNTVSGLAATNVKAAIDELIGQPASKFIFRPGGSAAGNIYTVWNTLANAMVQTPGELDLVLDDSLGTPTVSGPTITALGGDAIGGAAPNMTIDIATATFLDEYVVGSHIEMAGATTPANDGIFIVTGVTATQLSYTNNNIGPVAEATTAVITAAYDLVRVSVHSSEKNIAPFSPLELTSPLAGLPRKLGERVFINNSRAVPAFKTRVPSEKFDMERTAFIGRGIGGGPVIEVQAGHQFSINLRGVIFAGSAGSAINIKAGGVLVVNAEETGSATLQSFGTLTPISSEVGASYFATFNDAGANIPDLSLHASFMGSYSESLLADARFLRYDNSDSGLLGTSGTNAKAALDRLNADRSIFVWDNTASSPAGKSYSVWDELYTTILATAGDIEILLETNLTISGAMAPYNLDRITFRTDPNGRPPAFESHGLVIISATLSDFPDRLGTDVHMRSDLASVALLTLSGFQLYMEAHSKLSQTGGFPLLDIDTGDTVQIFFDGTIEPTTAGTIRIGANAQLHLFANKTAEALAPGATGAISTVDATGLLYVCMQSTAVDVTDPITAGYAGFNAGATFTRVLKNDSLYSDYDNTVSGLLATTVKAALDEIALGGGPGSVWTDNGSFLVPTNGIFRDVVIGHPGGVFASEKLRVGADGSATPAIRAEGDIVIGDDPFFAYAGLAGEWDGPHFVMGAYHFWVDAAGKLRVDSTAPAMDSSGEIVGEQGGG